MKTRQQLRRLLTLSLLLALAGILAMPSRGMAGITCSQNGMRDGMWNPVSLAEDHCTLTGVIDMQSSVKCRLDTSHACCINDQGQPSCCTASGSTVNCSPPNAIAASPGLKSTDTTEQHPFTFTPNIPIPGLFPSPTDAGGKVAVNEDLLGRYIKSFFIYFVGVAGILAVIMLMYGGFHYIISAGNPQKIKQGKEIISNAIIGLILLLTSYIILYTINPALIQLTIPKINSVKTLTQGVLFCDVAVAKKYAPNSLCGATVKYTENAEQKSCISPLISPADQNLQKACYPSIAVDKTTGRSSIAYEVASAEKICDDDDITPDNACDITETFLQQQDVYHGGWLKNACATIDGHCRFNPILSCTQINATQVPCSVGGQTRNTVCWKDGQPSVGNYFGTKLACRDPAPNHMSVQGAEDLCCTTPIEAQYKANIICSTAGPAEDEVELSDCTYFNNAPGKFASRDIGGAKIAGGDGTTCKEKCFAEILVYYSINQFK